MKIIRHASHHLPFSHPVIGLGNFDGVHLGHRMILSRLVEEARARQGTALAMTFYPHPLSVLRPERPVPLILGLREKLQRIAELGVDGIVLQRFGFDFSQLAPEAFVRQYLIDSIGVEKIFVGHNFSFGRDRAGNAHLLSSLGKRWGFEVEVVGSVTVGWQEVSSTVVRALLQTGKLPEATKLLEQPYAVSGRVVKGFQRGRQIGFPTANIRPRTSVLLPNGVYAVRACVDDEEYNAVANVGVNPTFGENQRTVETNLFDFSADLYGKRLQVSFVKHLRAERKFSSVEELVQQIREDADQARSFLSSTGNTHS